jgi:hypothetical protein
LTTTGLGWSMGRLAGDAGDAMAPTTGEFADDGVHTLQ